jgi:hypothetical protein
MNTFILAASSVLLALATSAAAHDECFITIGVGTSTPLTGFSATVDYQDAPGEFEGSGGFPTCEGLSTYSIATNDKDAERKMSLGLLSIGNPIVGPKDLLRCKWLPTSRWPVAADFDLSEQEGLAADLDPVDAMVSITSIERHYDDHCHDDDHIDAPGRSVRRLGRQRRDPGIRCSRSSPNLGWKRGVPTLHLRHGRQRQSVRQRRADGAQNCGRSGRNDELFRLLNPERWGGPQSGPPLALASDLLIAVRPAVQRTERQQKIRQGGDVPPDNSR